jgi:hypothetical protein
MATRKILPILLPPDLAFSVRGSIKRAMRRGHRLQHLAEQIGIPPKSLRQFLYNGVTPKAMHIPRLLEWHRLGEIGRMRAALAAGFEITPPDADLLVRTILSGLHEPDPAIPEALASFARIYARFGVASPAWLGELLRLYPSDHESPAAAA